MEPLSVLTLCSRSRLQWLPHFAGEIVIREHGGFDSPNLDKLSAASTLECTRFLRLDDMFESLDGFVLLNLDA